MGTKTKNKHGRIGGPKVKPTKVKPAKQHVAKPDQEFEELRLLVASYEAENRTLRTALRSITDIGGASRSKPAKEAAAIALAALEPTAATSV